MVFLVNSTRQVVLLNKKSIFRDVLGFVAAIIFFKVRTAHLSLEFVNHSG